MGTQNFMKKVVLRAPALSQSGYGVHSRQIARWLFGRKDVELNIQPVQWGLTPWYIDAELKNEGYDPSDNDFYQEIDNRIKTSFPHKFEEDKERVQETTSSPAQVVSGSSRSSPSSRKKIKLSQEDLRLAQKWNIPLETYAAQKLKVHQADGDYTDIK